MEGGIINHVGEPELCAKIHEAARELDKDVHAVMAKLDSLYRQPRLATPEQPFAHVMARMSSSIGLPMAPTH